MNKLTRLNTFLSDQQLDIAFIQDPATIRFFTNYSTDPHERVVSLVVAPGKTPLLFVPSLEAKMAREAEPNFTIVSYQDHENPYQLLSEAIIREFETPKTCAIEKKYVTLFTTEQLKIFLPELVFATDLTDFVNMERIIKTPKQIELLKESGKFADLAMKVGVDSLQVGISEVEVVAKIEYEMKKVGISHMSFDTMVLFGDHAADPHGEPGTRTLKENELVLFDLGTMYKGYASDMTRTAYFGSEIKEFDQEIHKIVQDAHDLAMQAVKPGMTAEQIDGIARGHIEKAGYGEYFIHRLGHGIGQSCHEFPSIMQGNDLVLQEGMCFSIEPGIYIPGKVGVRVEDCVVVTKDGCTSFTNAPSYTA